MPFLHQTEVDAPAVEVDAVADTESLARLQAQCREVYVDPALVQYAVRLVGASRRPAQAGLPDLAKYIGYGASPRATIGLVEGAKALAMLRGRRYALPEDLVDLAPDVLRHRLVLSYEALADGLDADALVRQLMRKVTPPEKVLSHAAEG